MPHTKFEHVEIWGNDHYCILPPSLHPSGVVYAWLNGKDPRASLGDTDGPPVVSVAQLEWLGIRLKAPSTHTVDLHGLPEWTACLSEANRRILATGAIEGERNTLLTRAIYDAAAAVRNGNVAYDDAERVILGAADRCTPPYPRQKVLGMLRSALHNPNLRPAKSQNQLARLDQPRVDHILEFAHNYDWRSHGRTGLTDRAVFLACIERTRLEGHTFRASLRELAIIANIRHPDTVQRSIDRLVDRELLVREGFTPSGARSYAFGQLVSVHPKDIMSQLLNNVLTNNATNNIDLPVNSPEKDIFNRLGNIAFITWKFLQEHPVHNKVEVARACNLNSSSVRSAFPKLLGFGFVSISQAEGLFIGNLLSDEELSQVAHRLGVENGYERQVMRTQRQREIRANRRIYRARERFNKLQIRVDKEPIGDLK